MKFPQLKKLRPLLSKYFLEKSPNFCFSPCPLFFYDQRLQFLFKNLEGKNKKRLISRTFKVKELFLQTAFPNNQSTVREFFPTDNMYGTVLYCTVDYISRQSSSIYGCNPVGTYAPDIGSVAHRCVIYLRFYTLFVERRVGFTS